MVSVSAPCVFSISLFGSPRKGKSVPNPASPGNGKPARNLSHCRKMEEWKMKNILKMMLGVWLVKKVVGR